MIIKILHLLYQLIKQVMSELDVQSSESQAKLGQYLRKYALLYSKCAKGMDSNVSLEEMNKELLRMAGYNIFFFFYNSFNSFCFVEKKIKYFYRTGQLKHLEKALEICDRQSLDIKDKLLLEFLKRCLHTMPARNLEEVLTNMEFNTLVQCEKQFYDNFILEVYEDLTGTNHNVLIAYYTALNYINPNNAVLHEDSLTPVQHIKLLKRVHSTIPGKHIFKTLRIVQK